MAQASARRVVASSASSHRAASHLPGAGLQPRRGLLSDPQCVSGQRGLGPLLFPGLGQQPAPVGAQRLQHHVPGPAIGVGPGRHQQRAVHQVQHRRPSAGPGHRLGGLERERSREHRDLAEDLLLGLTQQPVAPLHSGRQRPVPPGGQSIPGGQQVEPVIQTVQQPGHPQRLYPRGRQLNSQRHPIQPPH
jgi:hypothetical protein